MLFVFQRKMNFSLFSLSILLVVQEETQTTSVVEIVPLKIVLSTYELNFFFLIFKHLLNTPQRYNTNATINYKYVTLHYTMNFNGKVTIQKRKKNTF